MAKKKVAKSKKVREWQASNPGWWKKPKTTHENTEQVEDVPQANAAAKTKTATKVLHVKTKKEFDKIIAESALVAVDFSAKWCGPCKQISPVFKKLSEKNADCVFVTVDVDENEKTSDACNIKNLPTFHFYKDGTKVDEFSGADVHTLKAKVTALNVTDVTEGKKNRVPESDEHNDEEEEEEDEEEEEEEEDIVMLEVGMWVLVNRRGFDEKGKVMFPSKKKADHWAIRFESDGKIIAHPPADVVRVLSADEIGSNNVDTSKVVKGQAPPPKNKKSAEPAKKPEEPEKTEAQKAALEFLRQKAAARDAKRHRGKGKRQKQQKMQFKQDKVNEHRTSQGTRKHSKKRKAGSVGHVVTR